MNGNERKGAALALDRILKVGATEQAEGVPAPEQLERLPQKAPGLTFPEGLFKEPRPTPPELFKRPEVPEAKITPEEPIFKRGVPFPVITETGEEIQPEVKTIKPEELSFWQNPTYWLYSRHLLPDIMFSSMISKQAIRQGEQGLPSEPQVDEAELRFRQRLASDPNPVIRFANTPVTAGLTPSDIVSLGLLAYGGYYGVKSLVPVVKEVPNKVLQKALNLGLDQWIAKRSRGVPPQHFKTIQNALYNSLVQDRIWLQERATNNMLQRMGKGANQSVAATQAVQDTINEFDSRLVSIIPRGTQTGALAFGGLPAEPFPAPVTKITATSLAKMTIPERVTLVKSLGLEGAVGSKTIPEILEAVKPVTPEVTEWHLIEKTEGELGFLLYRGDMAAPQGLLRIENRYDAENALRMLKSGDIKEARQAYRHFNRPLAEDERWLKDKARPIQEVTPKERQLWKVKKPTPEVVTPMSQEEVDQFLASQKLAIPKAPPGMPEAGYQAAAFGVPEKAVYPIGKGVPTQTEVVAPPTLAQQLKQIYTDMAVELEAMKAGLIGLKGEEARIGRQTIKLLNKEVKNVEAMISRTDVPADIKGLRQQIMAVASFKGLPKTQLVKLFKGTTGKSGLTQMTQTQLNDVLKVVRETRPVNIKGRRVITEKTEKSIQSLKAELIKQNKLSDGIYQKLKQYLRIPSDKFESANLFITEKEGKALIRQMNYESKVGLIEHDVLLEKALKGQPELAEELNKLEKSMSEEEVIYVNKGVKISPWQDMWVYTEKLQNRTGGRFYDVYRLMLDQRLVNTKEAERLLQELSESVSGFKRISKDNKALKRINDYIASKHYPELKSPESITDSEIKLAQSIEKLLFSFQPDVRYNRFMTAYNKYEGNAIKMSADIPNAPIADLREAITLYESKGAKAISDYLRTKDWGVIKTGYEPHIVFKPSLQQKRIKRTLLPKGMLKTREGITFTPQEKDILQRTQGYIHRMLNLKLEPYLIEMDRILKEVSPKLREPGTTAKHLSLMYEEMKGTFYLEEPLARAVGKIGAYGSSVVYLSPWLAFRNLFQNVALYPDRSALINPLNRALTEADMKYFETYLNPKRVFTQEFLLQRELGTGRIANAIRRMSFMGKSEEVNNLWSFWGAINKGTRALSVYEKDGILKNFIKNSGVDDLTLRQKNEVLELLAIGKKNEAIWLIGRRISQNTNMIYDRAQGAPVTMGMSGRVLGSLLNFSRGWSQRIYQQFETLKSDASTGQRLHALKVILGVALFGMAAGELYKRITGKKQNPYNPLLMWTWTPGGLVLGATIDMAEVVGDIFAAVSGDKAALSRLPTGLARTGDMFIPFYSVIINVLESLTDTKNIDRLALREIRAMLDESYKPNRESYKKERSVLGKWQHAMWGGEEIDVGAELLDKLEKSWNKELNTYNDLPSETQKERLAYRRRYPETDAKLFIISQVTTLESSRARMIVLALIKEHNIPLELITGYEKEFGKAGAGGISPAPAGGVPSRPTPPGLFK